MSQSLELLLIQFLMPDNDARRQAEDQIKRLLKDPNSIPALIQHLRTAKTPNVRQLSAVFLRKKITGHWGKLTGDVKGSVKESLIQSIVHECSSAVRRASANVVSMVAKFAVPGGEWDELLPLLFQLSQSPQEEHREVALILFSSLTETIGDTFRPHFRNLQALLLKCLQDEGSSSVRVAALKAVGSFLEFTHDENEVVKFREFIPSILNVSRHCLANGEEDIAVIAFEIFDELIESPAPLLGESVRSIVQFSLEVCSSQNLESSTRHQAIQIISWLAKYKSSSLKKHKLVIPILQVMCPLLTESNEDEDDDLAPHRSAAEVIDTMACTLPKLVCAPIFDFASISSQSADPKYREAAVTTLGVISEGCFQVMKNKLEPVLQIVLVAFQDQEQLVRGAASFALGQFAEYLQPEIISHYKTVLPCVLNALEDANDDVKEKSYYALAAFCENMGDDILPFVDPLMGRLLTALQNSPRHIQETCMSAIGSVATAAEQAFIPYAERVLEVMKLFMVLTNDEDLCSRARATELVGIIAMSVGRAGMEPILPPFIEAAISGFTLEFSELREYSHGFFSNVSEILNEGFAQYLPYVVPLAISSCNLDDGSAVDIDEPDHDENSNGFDGVSSDDDAHDEPRIRNISIRTGVLDEKAAATQAIGMFALHTKVAYAPYFEESLKILVRQSGYFHEDVRLQAVIGLKHFLATAQALYQGHNEGPAKAREVLDNVMNIYIKIMTEDDDKEVVAQACMSAADIIKEVGYMVIEPYMPRLVDATLVLLQEKSACQEVESDSEEDDSEHDEVLMDAVSDLLPAFAKAMGSHFAPIFAKLFEPFMKFAKASRPPQDRTMVVACLAEVAQEMGTPISFYIETIMPLVLKELASSESTNRRNAAFCAGELCKNGGDPTLKYYNQILHGLYPMFGNSEPDDAVRDNAAGALARMIMVQPNSIPLDQVLPVLLNVLPLREDFAESMPVYSCICNLVLSSNPQVLSRVQELVKLFSQIVESPAETPEVKAMVDNAFSHLASLYGHQVNAS